MSDSHKFQLLTWILSVMHPKVQFLFSATPFTLSVTINMWKSLCRLILNKVLLRVLPCTFNVMKIPLNLKQVTGVKIFKSATSVENTIR